MALDFPTLAFLGFAVTAALAGLATIAARNPVHAALWLVLTFFSVACTWIVGGAEFLGVVLILVYVGAVMVLFLFVVMMLDIDVAPLREGDVRYDHILLAMVEEVAEHYGLRFDRFALFGYSGGGHFAHRFLMLQPHKLWGVSIGAPGSVTLLDPARDWWVGTRNFAELFGQGHSVMAVGDPQQSIYGFQGAAPAHFSEERRLLGRRLSIPQAA